MSQSTLPVALLSLLLLAAGDEPEPEPTPPPVGIEVQEVAGARITSVVLPGPIGDWAVLPEGDGRLILRADPDGEDSELLMVELGDEPKLEPLDVATGPHPGRLFVADLGGTSPEFLLGGEAGVQAISPDTLESRQVLDRGLMERPHRARYQGASLQIDPVDIELGSLAAVKASADGLDREPELATPIRARRVGTGLLLDSPKITVLPRDDRGPLYLVGPEAQGQRLRTVILDPAADEDDRISESWARLPGPEEVQYSWYAYIYDRLRLVVATKRSDRMGIFEKMALRVFPVVSDPTRGGRNALLKAETQTIWWNEMDVAVADVDGDGSEEMVVLQPDGLSGDDLVIDAYYRGPSTGFAFRPRTSKAKNVGSCWAYGQDVDGDGHPDLVTRGHDEILVYPGNAHRKKKSVVEKKSQFTLALPDDSPSRTIEVSIGTSGADVSEREERGCGLRLVDIDGDGRAEILTLTRDRGRGRLRVIELP